MNRAMFGTFFAIAAVVLAYLTWQFLQPVPHLLPGTLAEAGQMVHKEAAQYYTVTIAYPNRTPLYDRWHPSADAQARQGMETWLISDSAQFKEDIKPDQIHGPEKEALDASGRTYDYDATYKQYASTDGKFISYEYDIYVDTGGAHPNGYFHTFVFDKKGNTVTLGELFTPGSNYLSRIASIASEQVKAQLQARLGADGTADVFADGLAPRDENFSNFVIDGDSLMFLIAPYQAAAYAAGSFEVRIPLAQLADILKK